MYNINADLGEGYGIEKAIMPYLNSCNIACGGHSGDLNSIKEVVALAKQYHVNIGAHPSYPSSSSKKEGVIHFYKEYISFQLESRFGRYHHFYSSNCFFIFVYIMHRDHEWKQ